MASRQVAPHLPGEAAMPANGLWGPGDPRPGPPVVIVMPSEPLISETFIRAHIERLPVRVVPISGWPPRIDGRSIQSWLERAAYKAWRIVSGSPIDSATRAYLRVFERERPTAVLAEYGVMGVNVAAACRIANLPLIVHFHGFDATDRAVVAMHAETYPALFRQAAAIIAVSDPMKEKLIAMGAQREKVYRNFCGADCRDFTGGDPANAPARFLTVGRFTPKKGPEQTLRAFAQVRREYPDAEMRMIGGGPLLAGCRQLASELGVQDRVTFLGPQPAAVVREEMRRARCVVQHSVEAPSGDSEGTPVSIIEAGATGLPVISTRHAGILDVVVEGETGFLVEEHDVAGMGQYMLRIARDPELAARLGQAARHRVAEHFSIERSISELWRIIQKSSWAA
jgi:colanic acid/amylovoran biosynthesis glycosyltransferase